MVPGNIYNRFQMSLWHLSRQHLSRWHLSISGISQLLHTRFWWNLRGSILESSRTDSYYQVDIFPGNISPGDICPYQEYLSYYWLNFDQTLKIDSIFFYVLILEPNHLTQNLFESNFWTPNFFRPQIFLDPKIFWTYIIFNLNFLGHNFFWPNIFLDPTFLGIKFF